MTHLPGLINTRRIDNIAMIYCSLLVLFDSGFCENRKIYDFNVVRSRNSTNDGFIQTWIVIGIGRMMMIILAKACQYLSLWIAKTKIETKWMDYMTGIILDFMYEFCWMIGDRDRDPTKTVSIICNGVNNMTKIRNKLKTRVSTKVTLSSFPEKWYVQMF